MSAMSRLLHVHTEKTLDALYAAICTSFWRAQAADRKAVAAAASCSMVDSLAVKLAVQGNRVFLTVVAGLELDLVAGEPDEGSEWSLLSWQPCDIQVATLLQISWGAVGV